MNAIELARHLHKALLRAEWQPDPSAGMEECRRKVIEVPAALCESDHKLMAAKFVLDVAMCYANITFANVAVQNYSQDGKRYISIATETHRDAKVFDEDGIITWKDRTIPKDIEGGQHVPVSKAFDLIRKRESEGWELKPHGLEFRVFGNARESDAPVLAHRTRESHGLSVTFNLLEATQDAINQSLLAEGRFSDHKDLPAGMVVEHSADGKSRKYSAAVRQDFAREILVDFLGLDPVALGLQVKQVDKRR